METLKITASQEIIEKVKKFIQSLQNEEIELNYESGKFSAEQNYLRDELKNIDEGKAIFYSIEELDKTLEKTLARYEGKDYL